MAILHDLNLAALYADRLVMLKDGRCLGRRARPAEVLTEANILAVYGSRVKIVRHPATGQPQVMLLPREVAAPAQSAGAGQRRQRLVPGDLAEEVAPSWHVR